MATKKKTSKKTSKTEWQDQAYRALVMASTALAKCQIEKRVVGDLRDETFYALGQVNKALVMRAQSLS